MTPTPRKSGLRLPWSQHEEPDAAQPAETAGHAPEAPAATNAAATEVGAMAGADAKAEATAVEAPIAAAGSRAPVSPEPAAPAEAATDDAADNALLVSLVTAMREVAERERESSVSTLRLSVDEAVETLRKRSAEQAEQLRERSESDIAAIGDWVNAETERIAAEGERRRETRRQLLTQQLSEHEQRGGTEIESLYARIQEYERELTSFFAQVHEINDPAAFGAAAKRMPRPPSIVAAAAAAQTPAAPTGASAPESTSTPEPAPAGMGEGAGEGPAPTANTTAEATTQNVPAEPMATDTTVDETNAEATNTETAGDVDEQPSSEGAALEQSPPEQPAQASSTIVPDTHDARLSALGIERNGSDADGAGEEATEEATPASADAPASEGAMATDGGAEPSSDPLRARLAELDAKIGGETSGEPATATVVAPGAGGEVATAIVVHGLGSFGAITSFKQALERVDGVHGISLSLGPTGEFVYRATHEADFDLVAAIEQIEHGGAQIERQSDGSLRVVVQRGR
jgi:hypothetical protein